MRVSDIYAEVADASGNTDEAFNFRVLTRAIELLAGKGLFDPLLGTIDFRVDDGYLIALPRDVKTPLRINIENNPTVSRNRLFEFQPNSNGSVDGEEVGWVWHERGYSPIQDERKFPSTIQYVVTDDSDIGVTATIWGIDENGHERTETLTGAITGAVPSVHTYGEIRRVLRQATTAEAWFYAEDGAISRYCPDELEPEYRVIKLAKTGVGVRMLYRKHVFKITSQDDLIPIGSAMAVIRAVDSVRLFQRKLYADSNLVLEEAAKIAREEQGTRDEGSTMADILEIQSATNTNITTTDVLIVGDVYDSAAEILGPIGKGKLFDRITDAVRALENKTDWDSTIGYATLRRMENCDATSAQRRNGYFALPRYVEAVLAVNTRGQPGIPRTRWFEFHLNGTGETDFASCGTWDDAGDTPVINELPREEDSCRIEPTKLLAIPENALDEDKEVRVYGIERLDDGSEIEVYREGVRGWLCPCKTTGYVLASDAPAFVRIDRIKREATIGFVRLAGFTETKEFIALVGDSGRDDADSNEVAAFIKALEPDEVILLGDNNYEGGSGLTIDANIGKKWRTYIFPWLGNSSIAILADGEVDALENHIWPVPGNHDWSAGGASLSPNGLDAHKAYFTLPGNERYYSKVFGEVEVFFLDSDRNEPDGIAIGSVQYLWFVAAVAASTATWKVVCLHHTPKTSGLYGGPTPGMDWDFAAKGIHAVCGAHVHNYERWEQEGVIYFTVGSGASNLDGFSYDSPYTKYRNSINGALFMEATKYRLKFVFRDVDGTVLDTRELTNATQVDDVLLGYWYPDELEPRYRRIKIAGCCCASIRIRYKKRSHRVTSLYDVINLRSRLAVENMLRAIANQPTDPQKALAYEATAALYLSEEQRAANPIDAQGLQFDEGSCPAVTSNVR